MYSLPAISIVSPVDESIWLTKNYFFQSNQHAVLYLTATHYLHDACSLFIDIEIVIKKTAGPLLTQ